MTLKSKLVALDATWLVHRSAYAVSRLDPEQRGRAVAHQVAAWLYSYALIHKARLGFLAFDGPHCFRHDVYPLYKANRITILDDHGNPLSDEAKTQLLMDSTRKQVLSMRVPDDITTYVDAAYHFANEMGLPVVRLPHMEADDLLASAGALADEHLSVVLVTKDKDSLGSLREGVSQWYPDNDPKKPAHHIKHTDMSSRLVKYVHADAADWSPLQFQQYQVLTGDATDGVPPIIAAAKARKILNEHGTLGAYFRTPEGKAFREANQEFLLRNRELTVMRTNLLRPVNPAKQFALTVNHKVKAVLRRPLASAYADYQGWARIATANRSLF